MKLATAQQMKILDKTAIEQREISSLDLMERAARGVASAAAELLPRKAGRCRAAVFCGAGNNGGDGIAAARFLFLEGVRVRIFLVGDYEKLTPDALAMTGLLSECGLTLEAFDPGSEDQRDWTLRSDVILDALFGVGLSREIAPDSPYAAAIGLINRAPGAVVAADIASGVEADTGRVLGTAVRADRTVTFTLPKIGHFVGEGGILSGRVEVVEIGIPKDLTRDLVCPVQTIEEEFVRAALPKRKPDGHKGNFGKVLIVGGSVGYTGAPVLAAHAAERTGSGLVFLGVPKEIWPVAAMKCGGAMPFPLPDKDGAFSRKALPQLLEKSATCDALLLGPGLGKTEGAEQLALGLLRETKGPVVLDADGINAAARHIDVLDARRGRVTILTPHDGEFLRLGGDLSSGDRVAAARDFAQKHGCILMLKGHNTIVAAPEGNVLVNTTGNSGLAKGGSGDVLSGMILSLLGQGATPIQAAAAAVFLHGRAGDLCAERLTEYGMTTEDLTGAIPAAFKFILK